MIAGKEVKKRKPKPRKQQINTDMPSEDPLEELGYGIVAYNEMMKTFIWLFLLFSVLMAPAIYFNGNGEGYKYDAM